MGALTVHHDVVTTGGEGTSLVKGVQVTLKAVAFSVKPGGTIESVTIGGALRTEGAGVVTPRSHQGRQHRRHRVGEGHRGQRSRLEADRHPGQRPATGWHDADRWLTGDGTRGWTAGRSAVAMRATRGAG